MTEMNHLLSCWTGTNDVITHNVSGQFDEENSDAAQRKRHADSDVDQIWSQLRNVFG